MIKGLIILIEMEAMGKAAKWLKLFLTGKKEKEKERCGPPPVPMESRSGPLPISHAKEKKRWSFRRSVTGTAMEQKAGNVRKGHVRGHSDSDMEQRREAVALVMATAAARDAAAQAAAAVIQLTNTATEAVEEAAAIKIQSVFRSYLV